MRRRQLRGEKKRRQLTTRKDKKLKLMPPIRDEKHFAGVGGPCFLVTFTFRDAECNPSKKRRELMALRLAACTFTV